jgi:hypothetical protein
MLFALLLLAVAVVTFGTIRFVGGVGRIEAVLWTVAAVALYLLLIFVL